MNELTTKLTKINFKWLIEHCTDKENWKRSWTIYDYDNFKCTIALCRIDIDNNELVLILKNNENTYINDYLFIPMDEKNFNKKVFTKKLYNVISRLILNIEKTKIFSTEIYEEAREKDDEAYDLFEKKLNDYLDDCGVSDSEIRDAYIKKKIDDFDNEKYRDEVIKKFQMKVLTNLYAMLALQFDMQNDYQKIMNLSDINEDELKEKFEQIEYEYQEDMNDLLEDK